VAEDPQTPEPDLRVSQFYGHIAASLAIAISLWQATRDGGWLEAAFGGLATPFWIAVALWIAASWLAVRKRQHWWVILTAPFAIYPIAMAALLSAACLRGNCI
jgi:hypothetical protein